MADEVVTEDGPKINNVTLEAETANGIRYAVATLDESNSGEVPKSQLQAVVANVSRAIKIVYVADELDNYLPEKEKLTIVEFLEFLESKLLVKGKKLNQNEMDELSWVVVGQKYEDEPHLLSKKDAFKLWLAFKKLDITGELKVDVEELCIVLEKFVRGIGVQWREESLNEYAEDGAVTFWKFITCLENKFLVGVDKSMLREGLQDLFDSILDEVMKTGFLYKKGHSMLKTHKSRWYVLKPESLTYYVSSGYREKKGVIDLDNESAVVSIPDKGSNKYRFLVTSEKIKKEYEQTAPDLRTKQAWITAIHTAINCYGGETPLKRDLLERRAKRDADKTRKAEEEKRRQEQDNLLSQQRQEIDLLKQRKAEIEKLADDEKAMLDAEIKRREELEEIQLNLQQLLEDQKKAREEEAKIRAAKERLLEEERVKREQLEALRLQQQQELQEEKMQKEELIERQKEQELVLEEERKRLRHLEAERMKAEEAAKAAQDKLSAAETAAKNAAEQAKDRVRQLKTSIGLKGTVGPKVDPLVSHRGKGAFTLEEFLNRATEWSGLEDENRPQRHSSSSSDELVKATSTAAPNQNIPEFLRKAAAWSGLNPETYLENAEQTKTVEPPKVSAKPMKPPRRQVANEDVKIVVNGEAGGGEGLQVEVGNDAGPLVEEAKGVEVTSDAGSPVAVVNDGEPPEDEVGVGESVVVEEAKGVEVTSDAGSPVAVVNDGEPPEDEVGDGESVGKEVNDGGCLVEDVKEEKNEESEVKERDEEDSVVEEMQEEEVKGETSETNHEVSEGAGNEVSSGEVNDGGSQEVEEVNDGGSQEVAEVNDGGSPEVAEVNDGGSHEVAEVNDGGSQEVEEVNDGGSQEVEEVNDGGSQEVEEVNDGGSQEVAEVNDGGSQEIEEAKNGESHEGETKDEQKDVEEKDNASEVEEKDEESHVVNGESDDVQVSQVDNEEPAGDKVDNQCPGTDGEENQGERLCNGEKTDTLESETTNKEEEEKSNGEMQSVCNAKEVNTENIESKNTGSSVNEGEVKDNEGIVE